MSDNREDGEATGPAGPGVDARRDEQAQMSVDATFGEFPLLLTDRRIAMRRGRQGPTNRGGFAHKAPLRESFLCKI
jgi:hypothetical protein